MCMPKSAKDMTIHEMKMSLAEDDLRDAHMLHDYAMAAKAKGDESAYKYFWDHLNQRIARVENFCNELRKM